MRGPGIVSKDDERGPESVRKGNEGMVKILEKNGRGIQALLLYSV